MNEVNMNKKQLEFIKLAEEAFGVGAVLSRADVSKIVGENNLVHPYWFTKEEYRHDRGTYKLPSIGTKSVAKKTESQPDEPELEVALAAQVLTLRQPKLIDESDSAVPAKYPDYVPFGFFKDLRGIINSKQFYPVFITGLSGNGKTLMVEQVCAELNRECVRVNISIETDESDLLGGPTLVNGNVVNRDGPVLQAMKKGAVLLIDEVDRGSNKLMCLQGILEGKPYYNKKSGEMIYPKNGFTVIATANTKGRGSDDGKFISAQILDDAFLERFGLFLVFDENR